MKHDKETLKNIKDFIFELLFFLNKIAIIIMAGYGLDYFSDKYNIPWQIIAIMIVLLLSYELTKKEKAKKDRIHYLKSKIYEELQKPEFDNIPLYQKVNIADTLDQID